MLAKYLTWVSLCIFVSCAAELRDNKIEYPAYYVHRHAGSEVEDKYERIISNAFSQLKLELNIDRKLRDLVTDLEVILDYKLNKLEKKIFDKLEDYGESKVNRLGKDNPENIQQNIQDNEMEKYNVTELNKSAVSFNSLEKKIMDVESNLVQKLDLLDTKITNQLIPLYNETSANQTCSFDTSQDPDVNRNLNEWDNVIPTMETDTNQKIDVPETKTPYPGQVKNINEKLEEAQSAGLELEVVTNPTSEAVKNETLNETKLESWESRCKKVAVNSDSAGHFYSMDSKTFNHVNLTKNDNNLTYFEMHFAAITKAGAELCISPVSIPTHWKTGYTLLLDTERACVTLLKYYTDKLVSLDYLGGSCTARTDSELMATHIKIHDGKLEVTYEEDSKPVLTYAAADLYSMQYFSFSPLVYDPSTTILFDCPAGSR